MADETQRRTIDPRNDLTNSVVINHNNDARLSTCQLLLLIRSAEQSPHRLTILLEETQL